MSAMSCKRHKWSNGQMRMLPHVIRRGCQEANAEIFEKCLVCGKEKRITLMNVRRPSRLTPQSSHS